MNRVISWVKYCFYAFVKCMSQPSDSLIFLTSNPPIAGFIGYFFKRIRKQKYVMLIYDIYPDTLIKFGPLKENGFIARLWNNMNRKIWENAEVVFTLGGYMAHTMEKKCDFSKTTYGKIKVISNWADVEWIKPLKKEENHLAEKYGQIDKLTIMYAGNIGQTHDIETIIESAIQLKDKDSINFLFIGKGAKKHLVEKAKTEENLKNLFILPYFPEEVVPFSLAMADIAMVTLASGAECLISPHRIYYHMAAGSCIIGLCNNSEVSRVVSKHHCGCVISPGDSEALTKTFLELHENKMKLDTYCKNSRNSAVQYYSKQNIKKYIETMRKINAIPE